MAYEILPTTAEQIISATDAVLLKNGCDAQFVSSFLDIPEDVSGNALIMAQQIGLVNFDNTTNLFHSVSPFATYLVTCNDKQKAIVIRLLIEQYEPYKFFKERLWVTGLADVASEQVKICYALTSHRDVIKNTIISLGTFAQSLISEGAGLYRVAEVDRSEVNFLLKFDEIISQREKAEIIVRKLINKDALSFIDQEETLNPIITAYHKLHECKTDSRSPILYAGNAFESFLIKYSNHYHIDLTGKTGINSKIDKIANDGKMTTKHKFIGKYIGHIRNSCDHGVDTEINQSWNISEQTSHEYVHIVITCINNLANYLKGNFTV